MTRSWRRATPVLALAACLLLGLLAPSAGAAARRSAATPFDGPGMWIWSRRGPAAAARRRSARRRRRYGIRAVYVKSSDGSNMWSQFSRSSSPR